MLKKQQIFHRLYFMVRWSFALIGDHIDASLASIVKHALFAVACVEHLTIHLLLETCGAAVRSQTSSHLLRAYLFN